MSALSTSPHTSHLLPAATQERQRSGAAARAATQVPPLCRIAAAALVLPLDADEHCD